jgi:hypothetical protein
MDEKKLEKIYPDNYLSHTYSLLDREIKTVSPYSCVKLAELANEEYQFLLQNLKSGYYIVDWRVIYFVLDEFLSSTDLNSFTAGEMELLLRFRSNYEESPDVLYERLEKTDD